MLLYLFICYSFICIFTRNISNLTNKTFKLTGKEQFWQVITYKKHFKTYTRASYIDTSISLLVKRKRYSKIDTSCRNCY